MALIGPPPAPDSVTAQLGQKHSLIYNISNSFDLGPIAQLS